MVIQLQFQVQIYDNDFDYGYNYDCSNDKRENNWSVFFPLLSTSNHIKNVAKHFVPCGCFPLIPFVWLIFSEMSYLQKQ